MARDSLASLAISLYAVVVYPAFRRLTGRLVDVQAGCARQTGTGLVSGRVTSAADANLRPPEGRAAHGPRQMSAFSGDPGKGRMSNRAKRRRIDAAVGPPL